MTVRMTMSQNPGVSYCFSHVGVELSQQDLSRVETHEHSSAEQEPTNSQRTYALDFSISIWESFARGFQGPGNGSQCQKVGNEIGERVVGVGDEGLRVKDITADEFSNCHTQICDETNPGNANTSVAFVCRGKIGIVVVVVVVTVAMAMIPSLCHS